MQNSGIFVPRESEVASCRHCEERQRRSNPSVPLLRHGLLRGACHRARVRATPWLAMTDRGRCLGTHSVLLNNPIRVAFASVLKCKLKPMTAAEVSASTCSFSCDTAKIVKT